MDFETINKKSFNVCGNDVAYSRVRLFGEFLGHVIFLQNNFFI